MTRERHTVAVFWCLFLQSRPYCHSVQASRIRCSSKFGGKPSDEGCHSNFKGGIRALSWFFLPCTPDWLKVFWLSLIMNIGSLQILATVPPPLLFSDDCVSASSVEVDLGDLSTAPNTPMTRRDRSGGMSATRADTRSSGWRRERQQAQVRSFLERHKFKGVNDSILIKEEEVYPIHLAARLGKRRMLSFLVKEGAKAEQTTSRGRTVMDFAQHAPPDVRCHVVDFLHSQDRETRMTMREFRTMFAPDVFRGK